MDLLENQQPVPQITSTPPIPHCLFLTQPFAPRASVLLQKPTQFSLCCLFSLCLPTPILPLFQQMNSQGTFPSALRILLRSPMCCTRGKCQINQSRRLAGRPARHQQAEIVGEGERMEGESCGQTMTKPKRKFL